MHDEHARLPAGHRHGRKILYRIPRNLFAHERQQPHRAGVDEQRVAVALGPGNDLDRSDAAVIHDHLLAKAGRQPLREQPRDQVGAAAGFGGDHAHGLDRVILRRRDVRADNENGNRERLRDKTGLHK